MPFPATRAATRHTALVVAIVGLIAVLCAQLPVAAQQGQSVVDSVTSQRPLAWPAEIPNDEVMAGQVLVTYRSADAVEWASATRQRSLEAAGADAVQPLTERVVLVSAAEQNLQAVIDELRADPTVAAVEPNVRRRYLAVPDDTSYGLQWAHGQTNAEAAWDSTTGEGGTRPLIAILDSGIDATHPDLENVVVSSLRSANGQIVQGTAANDACGIGHGTAVAGVAAAEGNNAYGVTGVLWSSRVIDVALTSPENGCPAGPSDADAIVAMDYVSSLPEPPLALNMSLGSSRESCSVAYQSAVDRARSAGIVVVAAAGNDGPDATSVPASCDGVISVGATTADMELAPYSQTNPQIDLVAPGGVVSSITPCPTFEELVAETVVTIGLSGTNPVAPGCAQTDPSGQRLRGIAGTSFAAPYLTAAVGLLRQLATDQDRPLTVDQTEALLETTATDAGPVGRDCSFGWGVLDLAGAMDAVASGPRTEPQPDPPIGTGTCDPAATDFEPLRIAAGDGTTTDPIDQAIAISQQVIPDSLASRAVLARVDDFSDALAGSGLGFGVGPLLYTTSTGTLDLRTEAELLRALDRSGDRPTVYVMGGTAAIPAAVDARLEQLGVNAVRMAGTGREQTAALASVEIQRLAASSTFLTRPFAFVAYGRGFPDAVAAGQMAAYYGIPVLLTNTEGPLHPETAAELERLDPTRVIVLGGTAVVGDAVVADIAARGFAVERAAGGSRVDTAIEIARLYLDELNLDASQGGPNRRPAVVAVNLRNNFNDVLAASLLGGNGNIFLPLEGEDGSVITGPVRQAFCEFGGPLFLVGGSDVVTDEAGEELVQVLSGTSCQA